MAHEYFVGRRHRFLLIGLPEAGAAFK